MWKFYWELGSRIQYRGVLRFLKRIIFWSFKVLDSFKEQIYKFIVVDIFMIKIVNIKIENKIRKKFG